MRVSVLSAQRNRSSSIQTLLSVLESHQLSLHPWGYKVVDYTTGRESHPALKTFHHILFVYKCTI